MHEIIRLSAFLLSIIGVQLHDILFDYLLTKSHIENIAKINQEELPSYAYECNEKNILFLFKYLETNYDGLEKYLVLCGITKYEIKMLKKKFIVKS
ncbi:MAG: tyrosine-protein phosphatase [Oscillospiraceae bacterium]|nr:tyrosine-protein phosphatase [Oscillospiraceae bacterium]